LRVSKAANCNSIAAFGASLSNSLDLSQEPAIPVVTAPAVSDIPVIFLTTLTTTED
jgi:hypothetical protein